MQFIPAEDGSFIYVPNITQLKLETSYDDKTTIKAHHNGAGMPFTVSRHDTKRAAHAWLQDLVDRIEASAVTTCG